MWMRQSRGNTDLAEESLSTDRRAELVIQHLYRDFPLVLLLFGEMNSRHPAMAKQPLDYIAVGQCVDGGSRRVCHYPEYTARVQRNPPSRSNVERKRAGPHPPGGSRVSQIAGSRIGVVVLHSGEGSGHELRPRTAREYHHFLDSEWPDSRRGWRSLRQ